MTIKALPFEDKYLIQHSYAISGETKKQVVLIDPSRNPEHYIQVSKEHKARIVGVIETPISSNIVVTCGFTF